MIADGKGEHMSRVFANPLPELAEYEEMNQALNRGKGPVQISGCMDSQKVHLMEEAGESCRWKLVVTYDDSRAKEIYEDFRCFRDQVWLYPSRDLLFLHGGYPRQPSDKAKDAGSQASH